MWRNHKIVCIYIVIFRYKKLIWVFTHRYTNMNEVDKLIEKSKKIQFDAKRHIYYLADRPFYPYQSVTTLIRTFEHEFNPIAVSMACVKKKGGKYYGRNAQEVRDEWSMSNRSISELGTRTHKYAELTILGKDTKSPECIKEEGYRNSWFEWWKINSLNNHIVIPELRLYNEKLYLAGTCDFFAEKDNGHIFIGDFKTSGEIKKENKFKNFKRPLTHLSECNYNKYCLQLNIYKRLILDTIPNAIFDTMNIVWIREDRFEDIPVGDMSQEVELIFKNRLETIERR